jgi:hypothetical protein
MGTEEQNESKREKQRAGERTHESSNATQSIFLRHNNIPGGTAIHPPIPYLEAVLVGHELLRLALVCPLGGRSGGLGGQGAAGGLVGALAQVKVCHAHAELITHNVLELVIGTTTPGVSTVIKSAIKVIIV